MSVKFRIATWNLDHPKHGNHFPEQMKKLAEISAHIVVLTETSPGADLSHLGYEGVSSLPYRPFKNSKKERNSSAIWSKWPIECALGTYDDETATCAMIKAPFGSLLVYGTILTWRNDRWPDETGAP
ncbi:endonuclease/exonuclease/phosphatase family protein [Propionivibrio sp.]|uniref:endonuclease/exonuclease/phosphatase family protein n=1 Tax=Propionivibrio sp. TaxID=2212460 RepID=UPI003BF3C4FF